MGNQTDLKRADRTDRVTEKKQLKCEARRNVFAEVSHDRSGGQAGAHLGKRERGVFRHQHEVAHNGQAKSKTKRVALHLGDADERRSAQHALEFDEPRHFFADGLGIAAGAFAPRAESLSARADAQDTREGVRGFGTQLR